MANRYTPGPWGKRLFDDWSVDAPRLGVSLSTAAIGAKKRGYPVALVVQKDRVRFGDGDAEHDANLALIAASPDLLSAARKLDAELASAWGSFDDKLTRARLCDELHAAWKSLRAAIAKAEGSRP